MIITINVALILKYLFAGTIIFALGQLFAFTILLIVTLCECFADWSLFPFRMWDWSVVRMGFGFGLLASVLLGIRMLIG